MKQKLSALLAGFWMLLGATAASAAERAPTELPEIAVDPGLSLAGAVDHALARSPAGGLPGAYAEEAGALGTRADRLFAGPAEAGLRHQSDAWTDDRGLTEWEAGIALPLWRPGQRAAQEALAGDAGRLAQAVGAGLRLQVAGQVRDAVWNLMLAQEQARLTQQIWQTAAALARDVQRRVETGDLPRTDLLLAQDEALTRKDEYLAALQQLQDARRAYSRLTGLDRLPAEPGENMSEGPAVRHPALREAEAQVERRQSEMALLRERGSGQPTLHLNTRRERAFTGEPYQDSVGIGVSIPFGGGAHAAPEIAAANRALVEAQSERNRLRREMGLALDNAQQRIETLRLELALAEERQDNAARTLRMARIAFDVGEMELAQFLRVQNRAQNAEAALRIRHLELQQAIAQYNQAAGELP